MEICGIYTITNLVNRKIYVGCSVNIKARKAKHNCQLRLNKHDNIYLQKAWNKYGEENFKFEVLIECEEQFLYSEEHYWCLLLQVHNSKYGYNIQPTNPIGKFMTNKTTGKREHNPERRTRLNVETIRLITERTKKTWKSVDQFTKKGKYIKSYENMSIAARELNIPMKSISYACNKSIAYSAKGYKWQWNTTESISGKEMLLKCRMSNLQIKAREIIQYDMDMNYIREWESAEEVKREMGWDAGNIHCCLKGKYIHAYNYKWEYKKKD